MESETSSHPGDTRRTAVGRLESALEAEPMLEFRSAFVRENPGAELYLVGGAVRDVFLGRPNKDFDFVVRNVEPRRIEQWFNARGKIDLTGRNFGVYKFLPSGFSASEHEAVDLALPRTEHASENSMGGYRDFETQSDKTLLIETDLSRRDFTINAMAYDSGNKTLVDPFSGKNDLETGIIRAVGSARDRFNEDMSRMFRAIRFASQMNFEIEPETWDGLKQKMPEINSTRPKMKFGKPVGTEFVIPRETIGKEIAKAVKANPTKAAGLLFESGAFRELLPALHEAMENDSGYLFALEFKPLPLDATIAIILRGIDKNNVKTAIRDLGLTTLPQDSPYRIKEDNVAWIVDKLQSTGGFGESDESAAFESNFMNDRGETYLEVLRALGETETVEKIRRRLEEIAKQWNLEPGQKPAPLITGRDILAEKVKAGPLVRILLEKIRSSQLDGEVMDREAALQMLKEEIAAIE